MTNIIFDMPNRKPVKKDLSEIKEKKDLKNILKEVLEEPKEKCDE
tara:strand:+ start:153 stop:287 length:135 start_codon:yes stop_codon:yes gene_type:complete